MKLLSMTILILLASCSTNKLSTLTNTMEFNTKSYGFTIDAPTNWEYKKQQGFDSYVGEIYIGNKDTIHFDLGYYSSSLTCPFCMSEFDIEERLVKTKEDFEIINGLCAKFVLHKYKNQNEFGVHFDSLWTNTRIEEFTSRNIVKFTIYGKNISLIGQKQMRQVFRTIKFFKFD